MKKQMTEEEWLQNAPPGIKEAVTNAKQVVENEKRSIATKLVANISDDVKRKEKFDRYMTQSLEQLRETLQAVSDVVGNNRPKTAPDRVVRVPPPRGARTSRHKSAVANNGVSANGSSGRRQDDDDDDDDDDLRADYSGAAGGPSVNTSADDDFDEDEELLDVPTMNSFDDDDDDDDDEPPVRRRGSGKKRQ